MPPEVDNVPSDGIADPSSTALVKDSGVLPGTLLPFEQAQADQNQTHRKNRWASHVARHPWYHMICYLILALTLSMVGIIWGDLTIDPQLIGWLSRGTEMAQKQNQAYIVQVNSDSRLTYDEGWDELLNNVQPSWQSTFFDNRRRRRLDEETVQVIDPLQCDLDW